MSPGTPPANHTLPAITWHTLVLWALRRRRRVRVTGASMLPLLKPGDEVLVNPYAYQQTPPHPGDIVVARHPYQPGLKIIKRVTAVLENGQYQLQGDNPAESSDSRTFGPIPGGHIMGRVECRFA